MAGRSPDVHAAGRARSVEDPLAGALGMVPVDALADAATLPDALSSVLRNLDDDVSSADACRSIVRQLPDAPAFFGAALIEIAEAADRSGLFNAYHNPVHSRDVGVIFVNLMRLQAMLESGAAKPDVTDFLTGCCAAFGHDVGHDGTDGGPDAEPFRLEKIAADTVGGIMERHTVDFHLIERAYCAIMATEVQNGYRALEKAGRGPLPEDVPECLRGLAGRKNREIACLLRDADVMQSAGLTAEDHDRQTARLERERGIPAHSMGARGADFFLKDVIKGRFLSAAGHVFQPRLDRLLRLNALRAGTTRATGGLADFERTGS